MAEHRPATNAVQHLRKRGFHPRALTGCENNNSELGIGHGLANVSTKQTSPRPMKASTRKVSEVELTIYFLIFPGSSF